ncbi:segregation/condensation protein A [Candidatus Woesearchaeota archaeon]|nr:segregation/condensation protein A [Candidatus Woesearchaeota archaeon]
MQDRILDLLMDKNEISWQSMLYDLVKTEKMDPWDINITLLAQRFLERLNQMREMDLNISGKVVLAAAILLKIKSKRLVGEDLDYLDSLFAQSEESEEDLYDELMSGPKERERYDPERLIPRTPQPRKRKVSIYDLVNALQKAMEVKKRKIIRDVPPLNIEMPEKKFDLGSVIKSIYGRIKSFVLNNENQKLTFSQLIPAEPSKEDKVYTFIPLLHLTNQRMIDLYQQQHFGEIEVELMKENMNKEIEVENTEVNVEDGKA